MDLSAAADGVSFSLSSFARMNLSIGVAAHVLAFTGGKAGRFGAVNAQCFLTSALSVPEESGHIAPASIHCFIKAIFSGERGLPPMGMRACSPTPRIRCTSRLSPDFPGTIVLIAAAFESSRRLPSCDLAPWQPWHDSTRIGCTSRAKSTSAARKGTRKPAPASRAKAQGEWEIFNAVLTSLFLTLSDV